VECGAQATTLKRLVFGSLVVLAAVASAISLTGNWPAVARLARSGRSSIEVSLGPAASRLLGSSTSAEAGPPFVDAGPTIRHQAAPLSSAQLGAPLIHGPFVSECGAPETMKVVVKATVKMGRASDVDVKTVPASAPVASCVERAIRELKWDVSPKAEHVTVTY
jgi:hypothetical protein